MHCQRLVERNLTAMIHVRLILIILDPILILILLQAAAEQTNPMPSCIGDPINTEYPVLGLGGILVLGDYLICAKQQNKGKRDGEEYGSVAKYYCTSLLHVLTFILFYIILYYDYIFLFILLIYPHLSPCSWAAVHVQYSTQTNPLAPR